MNDDSQAKKDNEREGRRRRCGALRQLFELRRTSQTLRRLSATFPTWEGCVEPSSPFRHARQPFPRSPAALSTRSTASSVNPAGPFREARRSLRHFFDLGRIPLKTMHVFSSWEAHFLPNSKKAAMRARTALPDSKKYRIQGSSEELSFRTRKKRASSEFRRAVRGKAQRRRSRDAKPRG